MGGKGTGHGALCAQTTLKVTLHLTSQTGPGGHRACSCLQAMEGELRFFAGMPPHTQIPAVNPLVFYFRLLPYIGKQSAKMWDECMHSLS